MRLVGPASVARWLDEFAAEGWLCIDGAGTGRVYPRVGAGERGFRVRGARVHDALAGPYRGADPAHACAAECHVSGLLGELRRQLRRATGGGPGDRAAAVEGADRRYGVRHPTVSGTSQPVNVGKRGS